MINQPNILVVSSFTKAIHASHLKHVKGSLNCKWKKKNPEKIFGEKRVCLPCLKNGQAGILRLAALPSIHERERERQANSMKSSEP